MSGSSLKKSKSLGLRKNNQSAKKVTIVENTPTTSKSSKENLAKSVPANFRPYRLTLNKKLRDSMTKKRLEFELANTQSERDLERLSGGNSSLNEEMCALNVNESNAEETKDKRKNLIENIEVVEEEMRMRQRHIAKVNELQIDIARWRAGFENVVNDLHEQLQPYKRKAIFLKDMGIDENLLPKEEE